MLSPATTLFVTGSTLALRLLESSALAVAAAVASSNRLRRRTATRMLLHVILMLSTTFRNCEPKNCQNRRNILAQRNILGIQISPQDPNRGEVDFLLPKRWFVTETIEMMYNVVGKFLGQRSIKTSNKNLISRQIFTIQRSMAMIFVFNVDVAISTTLLA